MKSKDLPIMKISVHDYLSKLSAEERMRDDIMYEIYDYGGRKSVIVYMG
jgi:hypothetical protein